MKKTKIVCTIGPASESEMVLENLIHEGMNVARLNFSHGSHEEHKEKITTIKNVRAKTNVPIGIALDTKGPEIRLGTFVDERVNIERGDHITFTTRQVEGTKDIVSISYEGLPGDVNPGSRILIDDGLEIGRASCRERV